MFLSLPLSFSLSLYISVMSQLDHYPAVSYNLPEDSDTQFNLVKTLFLGKVYGECVTLAKPFLLTIVHSGHYYMYICLPYISITL